MATGEVYRGQVRSLRKRLRPSQQELHFEQAQTRTGEKWGIGLAIQGWEKNVCLEEVLPVMRKILCNHEIARRINKIVQHG